MQNWYTRTVIEYCERVGDSFWAEPINFFSNTAFFISAYFSYKLLKQHKLLQKLGFLLWIITAIGFGSAAYHSVGTSFALILDFVPIYAFILLFSYSLLAELFKNKAKAITTLIIFFAVQMLVSPQFPTFLNGSIRHIVNIIFFNGMVVGLIQRSKKLIVPSISALLVFVLAVVFRSLDNQLCAIFPLGTHFLWHILTALSTYLAIRVLVQLKTLH